MSTPTPRPKRPGRQDLARRDAIAQQLAEIKRKTDALRRELKTIDEGLEAWLRHAEPKGLAAVVCGWRLAITNVAKSVSWKSALVARCGAEAAAEDAAQAGTREAFLVERA